jgi:hypothetical protein
VFSTVIRVGVGSAVVWFQYSRKWLEVFDLGQMTQFLLQAVLNFVPARKKPPAATGALAKSGRSADATVAGYNITIIEEKSKAIAID